MSVTVLKLTEGGTTLRLGSDTAESVRQALAAKAEREAATAEADRAQTFANETALVRDQAADLVRPENIFIDTDLATAQAGLATGTNFKIVDSSTGLAAVYVRTAGGSDPLYDEITAAGLSLPTGAERVGHLAQTLAEKLGETISAKDLGILGDAVITAGGTVTSGTDQTTLMNTIGARTDIDRIIFPPGMVVLISDTVHFRSGLQFDFQGGSKIFYNGPKDRPAFISGEPGVDQKYMNCRISIDALDPVVNEDIWANPAHVGLTLYNYTWSTIEIPEVQRFQTGIKAVGDGRGFVYNKVFLGALWTNQIGLLCDAVKSDPGFNSVGWCNENEWFGGSWRHGSTTNSGLPRWGIIIDSSDGSYTGAPGSASNNRNDFYQPSFELQGVNCTGSADGTPIEVRHGIRNRVLAARTESASRFNICLRESNASTLNYFEDAYSTIARLVSTSTRSGSKVVTLSSDRAPPTTFSVNDAPSAGFYDGASAGLIGHHILASTGVSGRVLSGVTVGSSHVSIPGSRAVVTRWLLAACNVIQIRRSTASGFGGRVVIKFYDSAGQLIDGAGTTLPATAGSAFAWAPISGTGSAWGGAFVAGSDSDADYSIVVPAGAAFADVGIAGGAAECKLYSYQITFERNDVGNSIPAARKVPLYGDAHERHKCIDAIPTTGTHGVGEIRLRYTTSATGPLLYRTIAAGTPGTWETVAGIVRRPALTSPTGGTNVDAEARAAIDAIRAALQAAGVTL